MQYVNFEECRGLTGTAESQGMSDGHILFNTFLRFSRTRFLLPHFILLLFFSFLMPRRSILFLAGDLAQLKLPVGMKNLILDGCDLTGKAQLRE